MRRFFRWIGFSLLLLIMIITGPILYVETMCRANALTQEDAVYITQTRPEARTYMVYPEWHIVYAYEGYAEALRDGHPHHFPYITAVSGFWSSLCGLTEKADELGEAGFNSKATIYTIGASFTLEMLFKAAYEETIGRIFSLGAPSPQDQVEANMADDYATFLQQVPWYKYDFPAWSETLWAVEPVSIRGWERRLALGLEWGAKTQYAKVIAQAAAGLGADELTMQIAVRNLPEGLADVTVQEVQNDVTIAKVPRYRIFTSIAQQIAQGGGKFVEIAGNDDILVSIISNGEWYDDEAFEIVARERRVGFSEDRVLIATKVSALDIIIDNLNPEFDRLEHIYDY